MAYVSKLDEPFFIAILRAIHRAICSVGECRAFPS
jgi:hypothetical protein